MFESSFAHLTSNMPLSGQAATRDLLALLSPCLPLRGGVRKHEGSQFAPFDRVSLQQGLLKLSNLADT